MSTFVALPNGMATDRRFGERRLREDRRKAPSATLDVSRLEHENLYQQVMENVRSLRRIERELRRLRELIEEARLRPPGRES
jgi:hypothetical protein